MATTTQTELLEDQYPLAAQIPLSSFTLPTFPQAASHLRALTLTSDINLNDYQLKHLAPGTFEPSSTIPSSITHLTLELFSLGFPAPFLRTLAESLPHLQSLTLFSCLIDGIDDRSRHDALNFFKIVAPGLRELHVVDTFARAGFWKDVSSFCSDNGLRLLEVSYTYRGHHESDFLNRTAGEEWAGFLSKDLIGLTLNFAGPPAEDELRMQAEKAEDQEELKAQDGILPYASDGRASQAILSRLKNLGKAELKVLNMTMFTLEVTDAVEVVAAFSKANDGLVGFAASVLVNEAWLETLADGLKVAHAGNQLESIEIVCVPVSSKDDMAKQDVDKLMVRDEASINRLITSCTNLSRFEMTLLKSRQLGAVVWEKKAGWTISETV